MKCPKSGIIAWGESGKVILQISTTVFFRALSKYFSGKDNSAPESEEGPPVPPGRGASHMLRGLMLRRRAVLGTPKGEKSVGRRGSAPDPAGGSLQRSPRSPSWWKGAPRGLCCPPPQEPHLQYCHCACPVCMYTCV